MYACDSSRASLVICLAVINSVAFGATICLAASIVLGNDFEFCATFTFHVVPLFLIAGQVGRFR